MRGLRVLLLGRPRLEVDGQALAANLPLKHQALLCYLAAADGPVGRAELAALLWEDLDEAAARGNLRTALMRLRRALPGVLTADARAVGFEPAMAPHVDWADLARAAAGEGTPATRLAAARAWRGPLLEGFDLGGDTFERWLATARVRAQRQAVTLRRALAVEAAAAGRADDAESHWRALLEIDDADEDAHIALMTLLSTSGRRTAAIAQYETCRAALLDRLGARPSAACYALYTRIHSEATATPAAIERPVRDLEVTAPAVAADDDAAGLIGRTAELALLAERLLDPGCRWLTIIGPGGVGKTRLAQAAAAAAAARARHGLLWLSGRDPGGALRDPEALAQQVLARTGTDRVAPDALLLVLDNMETVADAPTLARLLQARAPGVAVLATSRRRLGVAREWLLELDGLSLARSAPDRPASSPAALLLVQAVRRLQPGFDPAADDGLAAAAEDLCKRVGGLPLAIELAARGIQQAGLVETVRRLRAGAPLEDPDHDAALRHHSIAVVLDDAWTALPAEAQTAALRLAWLPDAFDLGLAEQVGASASQVAMLREHSWLRHDNGRLALHPLQQDHLRRHALAAGLRPAVRQALASAVDQALPEVAPFGDWPIGAGDPVAIAAGARFAPAVLSELRVPEATPMSPGRIDALVALLLAADRADEAVDVLEDAKRRVEGPAWRQAGWSMRIAEIVNRQGDGWRAWRTFEAALAQLGLADASQPERAWRVLPAAAWRAWTRRHWPPPGAERRAFERLLMRALMLRTQLQTFGVDARRAGASNALHLVVASRAGPAQRGAALTMSAYGAPMFTGGDAARWLLGRTRGRPPVAEDPLQEAFSVEGECATRIALGDWSGVEEPLRRATALFEAHGDHRHAMECLSLAAKLCFYQGRLREAFDRFGACTERSLRRPGGAWRAWGPFGQAESALCLGSLPLESLQQLADTASHWLTEMENIDAAYALRRFGLTARLALRTGDLDRAREAVLVGAAAADRARECGFWAHEGFAGLGEALLSLRRHERETGGALPPLDAAWSRLEPALARHARRFPAGAAMRTRLLGQWHFDQGDAADAASQLRLAVTQAERQGLRVELARACEALAAVECDMGWSQRAARLWEAMGAAAASPPQ